MILPGELYFFSLTIIFLHRSRECNSRYLSFCQKSNLLRLHLINACFLDINMRFDVVVLTF